MQRFRDRTLLLATVPERLAHSDSLHPKDPESSHWQVDSLRIDRGSVTVAGRSHTTKKSYEFSDILPKLPAKGPYKEIRLCNILNISLQLTPYVPFIDE